MEILKDSEGRYLWKQKTAWGASLFALGALGESFGWTGALATVSVIAADLGVPVLFIGLADRAYKAFRKK